MTSDARAPSPPVLRQRRVMYIPGYDPVPPRAYRERYRREAAKQAALSGYEIALGAKRTKGRFGWHVSARLEGQATQTDIELLYWADIVRASMDQGIWASYAQLLRTAWAYIGSGALWRLMRLRKGPVIAALYPVVVLLAQLAVALGAGAALAWGLSAVMPVILAAIPGAALVWAVLRWCQRRDHLLAWYLIHDYAFSAQAQGAYPAAQERRMAEFADQIKAALASDTDEVLIVGHSSGAYLAISILADLIRAGHVAPGGPALSLLTLGHVVPMVSFLPRATRLRADLACLSVSTAIAWVDVTAPGDGCCFELCDPVAVTGVAPDGQRWPLVVSAAFRQTLRRDTWRALRWRLFETHFQYLNAFDNLPGRIDDYDYFRITAGPLTLADRMGGRSPSKGRIGHAVNRYRDIAP